MIVLRLFGHEVLAVGREPEASTEPGDCTTSPMPVGFHGPRRYEPVPGGDVE